MDKMTKWLVGAAIGLFVIMSSVFIVKEGETAIVLNLGKVVRTGMKPGLHFKMPLVETVKKYDRRILTMTELDEPYLTSEQINLLVDFFVNWRIKDEGAYYRAIRGDMASANDRLRPMVIDGLRNVVNSSTLKDLTQGNRTDITREMIKTINLNAQTLGIEIVDVRIKRIDYPDSAAAAGSMSVLDSVYDRMRKDRGEVANRTRAEGDEAAQKIRSEAERDRQVILANAELAAQLLRGEGDAIAAEVSAGAYNQDADFYAFHRSLEAYRASLADGKTVMVLDPDSEFLKYFGNQR
ncbi:MAG: protease modulator HflC [Arenimonas sp.]